MLERIAKKPKLLILFVFFGVAGIWILFWRVPINGAFEGASSLFTGLAFAGLIITIWQQGQELKAQREELRLQRKELAKSIEELKGQKKQMILQNEQSFFFKLLEVFQKSLEGLSYYRNSDISPRIGAKALKAALNSVDSWIRQKEIQKNTDEDDIREMVYGSFFDEATKIEGLFLYQKSRHNLLSFISSGSDENKDLFKKTVTGLLSTEQYQLMVFDSLLANHEKALALINDLDLFWEFDERLLPPSIRSILNGIKTYRSPHGYKSRWKEQGPPDIKGGAPLTDSTE